jgi:hypothetical protein
MFRTGMFRCPHDRALLAVLELVEPIMNFACRTYYGCRKDLAVLLQCDNASRASGWVLPTTVAETTS